MYKCAVDGKNGGIGLRKPENMANSSELTHGRMATMWGQSSNAGSTPASRKVALKVHIIREIDLPDFFCVSKGNPASNQDQSLSWRKCNSAIAPLIGVPSQQANT
jgi:hypothetical protein